jgi:DNA repair exonuclease SbcCD ATPase subunit
MVEQTKAYQNDLERERSRAVQLEEAVRSYKKQLAEARDSSHGLEEEIHEKDTQYCEAIRNERNQRKSVEAELESFRLSMEDALRRRNEIEKENVALKDKVQRQEKYIGRLQDRDKQNRRQSKAPRPSYMAGIEKEPPRIGSKISSGLKQQYHPSFGSEENTRPNLTRRMDEDFAESAHTDEVTSLLR